MLTAARKDELQTSFPEAARVLRAEDIPDRDLEVAQIPADVVEIAAGAFRRCARLKNVVFAPNSRLETIGAEAFRASGLTEFSAPESLRRVAAGAFAQCRALARVVLGDGLEALGDCSAETSDFGVFQGAGLESVKLPSGLCRIPYAAFHDCARLRDIQLPQGLREVGPWAFAFAGL